MYKLGIDIMGGDYAPYETLKGVKLALDEYKDLEVVLYGDENIIKEQLKDLSRVEICHTTKFIDMGEKDPVTALRKNRDASLALALTDAKNNKVMGVVSAGPTQALVVGAHLFLKRMDNMRRTAICPIIPSVSGKKTLLLDSGANVELKPEDLCDLAFFASVVCKCLKISDNPKVGLLNIGTEPGKGRMVDKETYYMLKDDKRINFYGNVEGKEILTSDCDILVTDGFTGNMVMKTMEGTALGTGEILKNEIKKSFLAKIGYALFMRKAFKNYKDSLNPKKIGGAMLLGVNAPIIKAHGSSDAFAFKNGIKQCLDLVRSGLIKDVKENWDASNITE